MARDTNGKELPKGITQRKDGRYMGRFTYEGEAYCLYDRNLKKLEKAISNLKYEVEHGLCGSAKRVTLNQWFEEWLSVYKETTVKASTRLHFDTYYRIYIKKYLGNKEIRNIKAIHVQKLFNKMVKDGYKQNTIKKVRNILNNMFVIAVQNDLIIKNPCSGVIIPKTDVKERRVLTEREQRNFLQFLHDNEKWQRYEQLFIIAFGTGLRIGELLALNWTDVDFKENYIDVNKTLYYCKEDSQYRFIVQTPKTKTSFRQVPMMKHVATAFKMQKKYQLQHMMLLGDKWEPLTDIGLNNLVFTTEWGKPVDRNSINRVIGSIVKAYNNQEIKIAEREGREPERIEYFSAHTTRHTFATRCFEKNIPPKVVQGYLGHATLAMTMDLYTHVTKETEIEQIQKLASTFE